MSGEPAGSEGFAWIWVLWALKRKSEVHHIIQTKTMTLPVFIQTLFRLYLDARRDVINDPDGFAVWVAR